MDHALLKRTFILNASTLSHISHDICKLSFMTYGQRLDAAMKSAADRGLLPRNPRAWRKALVSKLEALTSTTVSVQAIGDVLRNEYEFKSKVTLAIATALGVNSEWLAVEVGAMLPEATPAIGNFAGQTGQTPLANVETYAAEKGQLLPLLPWNRVDLMLLPNDAPEVQALEKQDVWGGGAVIDPKADKALLLEMDVEGTIAKSGYIAVFRPATGRKLRPTVRPILIRSPRGTHHFVSYNTLAGMSDVEVLAVCIHCYLPMHEDPFLD